MTADQAKQAFQDMVPVVFRNHNSGTIVKYERIAEMIYYHKNGRLRCSVALTDSNSPWYVRTSTRNIALYDKNKPLTEDNYFKTKRSN